MDVRRAFCAIMIGVMSVALAACERAGDPDESDGRNVIALSAPAELQIDVVREGAGAQILAGQTAVVHYTGWLFDADQPEARGHQFDSSHPRGQPFSFEVGAGRVIRGWDEGVAGMRIGELRRLIIPPAMAYGERGAGGVIPPDATLLFEVELLAIE